MNWFINAFAIVVWSEGKERAKKIVTEITK